MLNVTYSVSVCFAGQLRSVTSVDLELTIDSAPPGVPYGM